MAILKAGAYGHGLERMAMALEGFDDGPLFFGVASVIEARRLTQAGCKTRIYLLGPTCDFERAEIVAQKWTPCVSSIEEAEDFNRLAREAGIQLAIHVTVDTGMGRGGFLPDGIETVIRQLKAMAFLKIEGVGSHLPSADEDEVFTHAQFKVFEDLVLNRGLSQFRYRHLANSAGILHYNTEITNLNRPGLMLYGSSPIEEYQSLLKPVMSLKSRVTLVRELPAGQGVSYGRDTILEKPTKVATIGIGYGDGYPREVTRGGASVLIRGERCPLLGRVTMDQIMVDVTHLTDCQSGDEVELFGEHILVSEVAQNAETIPWAVLTGITPRVTRVYLES